MSKNKWQEWPRDKAWHTSRKASASSWSYWQGSHASAKPTHTKDKFPTYSQVDVASVACSREAREEDTSQVNIPEDDSIKALQKALNMCRRLDGKLRKLQEARVHKQQQWEEYEKAMRQSFLQQKRAYKKDMEQIEKDVAATHAANVDAAEKVRLLATGSAPKPPTVEEELDASDRASWDALVAEMEEDSPGPSQDAFMAKALQTASAMAATSQAYLDQVQPRLATPKRTAPASYTSSPGPACTDPYMNSPSLSVRANLKDSEQAARSSQSARPSPMRPRAPVKANAMPKGVAGHQGLQSGGLGSKLEQRRAALADAAAIPVSIPIADSSGDEMIGNLGRME